MLPVTVVGNSPCVTLFILVAMILVSKSLAFPHIMMPVTKAHLTNSLLSP